MPSNLIFGNSNCETTRRWRNVIEKRDTFDFIEAEQLETGSVLAGSIKEGPIFEHIKLEALVGLLKKRLPKLVHTVGFESSHVYAEALARGLIEKKRTRWIVSPIPADQTWTSHFSSKHEKYLLIRSFNPEMRDISVLPPRTPFPRATVPARRRGAIAICGDPPALERVYAALWAVFRCKKQLKDFEIEVYSNHADTRHAAEFFAFQTGLRIQWKGVLKDGTEVFRRAIATVFPTRARGPSCHVWDALLAETIPILSDGQSLPLELSHRLPVLKVNPDEPRDIERALKSALKSPEKYVHSSQAHRNEIKNQCDARLIERKVRNFYEVL